MSEQAGEGASGTFSRVRIPRGGTAFAERSGQTRVVLGEMDTRVGLT